MLANHCYEARVTLNNNLLINNKRTCCRKFILCIALFYLQKWWRHQQQRFCMVLCQKNYFFQFYSFVSFHLSGFNCACALVAFDILNRIGTFKHSKSKKIHRQNELCWIGRSCMSLKHTIICLVNSQGNNFNLNVSNIVCIRAAQARSFYLSLFVSPSSVGCLPKLNRSNWDARMKYHAKLQRKHTFRSILLRSAYTSQSARRVVNVIIITFYSFNLRSFQCCLSIDLVTSDFIS